MEIIADKEIVIDLWVIFFKVIAVTYEDDTHIQRVCEKVVISTQIIKTNNINL